MKISVIIPFYCEINIIDRAVASVAQNANGKFKYEIIICNDGVIPNEDIQSRIRTDVEGELRIITNQGPRGPGGARNSAINLSNGDLVAFLDADDFWLQGKLSAQIDLIDRHNLSFSATGYKFDGTGVSVSPPVNVSRPTDAFLKRGIGTSTVVISRSLLGMNRFRDIRYAQDIDFWYRLAMQPNFRYGGVAREYAVYSTSGSTKNKFEQFFYMYKILRLNNVTYRLTCNVLLSYAFYGVARHWLGMNKK